MSYRGRLIFREFVNKVQIPKATAALRSPIAFKIAFEVNFTQFCLQMCIFFVLRGHPTLEATVKKCSLWQQKRVFLAHIHFFLYLCSAKVSELWQTKAMTYS